MIARDWNVKHSGVGYVTRFEVRRDFLDRYEVHQVGGQAILDPPQETGRLPRPSLLVLRADEPPESGGGGA